MRRRAIFVDQDGALCTGELAGSGPPQLAPGAADAVRRMNRAGWQVVVVCERPEIALGELDEDRLADFHERLRESLLAKDARIDGIYLCPHHPEGTVERLRRVAAAAVEQCERSRLPEIEVRSWDAGLELLEGCERRWLMVPGAPAPAPLAAGDSAPIALLVGPEGGWTGAEAALLEALPCLPVGVGPTVLRVETAAVVGAALALQR